MPRHKIPDRRESLPPGTQPKVMQAFPWCAADELDAAAILVVAP
jgi:hypothetical protein